METDHLTGPATAGAPATGGPCYLDVAVVRRDQRAPGGESTAIRLLALLPGDAGRCTEVDADRVRLRIPVSGPAGSRAARRALRAVLADRALLGWAEEPAAG
ncbi:hypothetical protein [Streptomyces lonarensis]|nr:hypothetical protein [Streptomyces lonarensis]